ncbi:TolC family protein [Corallincola holothuriorum]|uniref:TolC family protein n=1 Tax=Corallincola holothuriorum TaxID=2282215 RepID=A0A368NNK2_9GAMM|nr:TolC family protein [Corallincola holothuriorum]RCU51039.1 TolC family protein [Corallincola holothuriorum]
MVIFANIRRQVSENLSVITARAIKSILVFSGVLSGLVLSVPIRAQDSGQLTLNQVVRAALSEDIWQQGNELRKQVVLAEGVAAGQLPDPKITLSAANVPVDSFDLDQEAMTQLKVGVSQIFPRGDTLELKQLKGRKQAELTGYQGKVREAQVAMTVSQLFLDVYLSQQTIALIEASRTPFEQLVQVTEVSYGAGLDRTRQADIIRAELELGRLDERLDKQWQQYDGNWQSLMEWLPQQVAVQPLSGDLPAILPLAHVRPGDWLSLSGILAKHPSVLAIRQQIDIAQTDVDISKQGYKPEWGLNTNYGYRQDAPDGSNRSDFISVGVTFDLPLFTDNRQDKKVSSAIYRAEAIETERLLILRKLRAEVGSTLARIERLNQRDDRYQEVLLPQVHQQSESSLSAYTNDVGDFAEVMRAHIAELNTKIEALQIQVERLKMIVRLNYLLAGELN